MSKSSSGRIHLDAHEIAHQFVPNEKTGNVFSTSMHIICAVVGIGVLALPYSIAYLGWIAGPLCIVFFWLCTWLSSSMLASLYYVDGHIYGSYHHLVNGTMGRKQAIFLSFIQVFNLILIMLAYGITGGLAVTQVANIACTYEGKTMEEVSNDSSCLGMNEGGTWKGILIFGAAEVIVSQVRSLEETGWLSAIGTACSLAYSLVAIIISFANLNEYPSSLGGVTTSTANKVFGVFNALGAISTSFVVSVVQVEIQDTLAQPPSPVVQMKKTMAYSLFVSFILYMLVGCAGYGSMGNDVDGVILDSFTGPRWALLIAYCALLLHMLTAFQIFAQAFFEMVESHIKAYLLRREEKKRGGTQAHLDGIAEEGEEPGSNGSSLIRTVTSGLGFEHSVCQIEKRFSHEVVQNKKLFEYSKKCILIDGGDHAMQPKTSSTFVNQSLASYGIQPGFTHEDVPFNADGVYLHWGYRLVNRTIIVLLVLLICCIMPFFTAFVGLVGAITFFPLAIHFPFRCYQKTFHTSKQFDVFIEVLYWVFVVISAVSIIGSVRSVIVGWSTYKIFG
jgi:amino acid permease